LHEGVGGACEEVGAVIPMQPSTAAACASCPAYYRWFTQCCQWRTATSTACRHMELKLARVSQHAHEGTDLPLPCDSCAHTLPPPLAAATWGDIAQSALNLGGDVQSALDQVTVSHSCCTYYTPWIGTCHVIAPTHPDILPSHTACRGPSCTALCLSSFHAPSLMTLQLRRISSSSF
jgi:hypothetical protein